ncbi:hypothetical protein KC19_10G047900 [Ceratodon purpureus]|uniref:Uncharacterized protein n=1 Tax=Ceratodon purpureus TaxID=3225 RepID=A0A8T0GNV5_CERPU|nr:hypothetical protein KC19_10G047900 [Ceratodon purpureus]
MHLPGCATGAHRSHHLASLAHLLARTSTTSISTSPPTPRIRTHSTTRFPPRAIHTPSSASSGRFRPWLSSGCQWRAWSATGRTVLVGGVGEEEDEDEEGVEDESRETKEAPHVAVLLKEVVAQFAGRSVVSFVDCTLGAAGHASAILREHPELETFIGLDVDPVAHGEARPRLQRKASSDVQLHLVLTNFRNIKKAVTDVDAKLADEGVNGILMDLGMSSMQVNVAERGFSFMKDGPADMRMDPSASLTAEEILNKWPEAEVARILRDYGEERRWKQLARKIVEKRLAGGIHSTSELVELIGGSAFGRPGRGKAVHPATRTFQALRIAVNDELRTLEKALTDAFDLLSPKGRLAVISFHSLEDRIVKRFFLKAAGVGQAVEEEDMASDSPVTAPEYRHIPGETRHSRYTRRKHLEKQGDGSYNVRDKNVLEGSTGVVLTKRPIVAEDDEINTNPRSRSAKLRVIEKL